MAGGGRIECDASLAFGTKHEYAFFALAEPRPVAAARRWPLLFRLVMGGAAGGILLALGFLVLLMVDDVFVPRGTVQIIFVNETPAEVRLVSLTLGGRLVVQPGVLDEPRFAVPRPHDTRLFSLGPRAPAGRQRVDLVYCLEERGTLSWRFEVGIVADHFCTVTVTFTLAGPSATACKDPQIES
jgi:hypothetical protein